MDRQRLRHRARRPLCKVGEDVGREAAPEGGCAEGPHDRHGSGDRRGLPAIQRSQQ